MTCLADLVCMSLNWTGNPLIWFIRHNVKIRGMKLFNFEKVLLKVLSVSKEEGKIVRHWMDMHFICLSPI